MATENTKLLNRIEDDQPPVVVSRNLTRLCVITSVFMFFFMIASVALAAILAYTKINDNNNSNTKIVHTLVNISDGRIRANSTCLNTDCVKVAARLATYMDPNVKPCEDFYKYSCGGWEEQNSLPEGVGRWGTFEQLTQSNYQYLIKALSSSSTSDPEAVAKAKRIFAACTNTEQINKDAPEALKRFITLTGGWDETNITQNSTWSINSSLVVEHYYGSAAFFAFDIEPDDMNSSKAVIKVRTCDRKCV